MLLLICSLSLLSILKYIVNEKLEVRLDENYSPCQVGSDFACPSVFFAMHGRYRVVTRTTGPEFVPILLLH